MLRSCVILGTLAGLASAAVWKEPAGGHAIRSVAPFAPGGNQAVWDEYGLQSAEQADFGAYRAVAYHLKDPTGAYAAWDWLKATDRSAALSGNLVFTCSGSCPSK